MQCRISMSIFSSHIKDPLRLELRSLMKGDFIDRLQDQPDTMTKQWPGAKLVIFGSTLMRQLDRSDGVRFPYPGRKSSDIDFGIEANGSSEYDYKNKFEPALIPIMHKAVLDNGAGLIVLKNPNGKPKDVDAFSEEQTLPIPPEEVKAFMTDANAQKYLANDFILYHDYTKEEMYERLSTRYPKTSKKSAAKSTRCRTVKRCV